MAKEKKNGKKQIRWEVDDEIYRKIGIYQKSHGISTLEIAGNILLKKATSEISLLPE